MSTKNSTKINRLLSSIPKGIVLLSSWFNTKGYSHDLIKRYKSSQWLKSIGYGAMILSGDDVDYLGGLYALQQQANLNIHLGARTALSLLGKAQYLEVSTAKAFLFGGTGTKLPSWFKKYDWGLEVEYYMTSILPPNLGLIDIKVKEFSVKVSSPARAILECLYLTPKHQELSECYELMESMNNLRPSLVQQLLENCSSIKIKRLFLYLAERNKHEWFEHLDIKKIDLGKGKRRIVCNGPYDDKYQITIPKEWKKNDY
jgi:hypothetical protein